MGFKRESNGTGFKRLLSLNECCDYLGLGRNKARQFAEEAGAVYHYGGRVLFDRQKLDAKVDSLGV